MSEEQFTVMLVEDDRGVQRALAEALHDAGFTVLAEHDGDWARRTFAQRRVDLIILDVVLPRRNGFQLALDIRRSGKKIPILMMSGVYGETRIQPQLEEIAPPVRFLRKPFAPSQLVAIVRKALGLQESEVSDPATRRRRRDRARLEAHAHELAGLSDLQEAKAVESDSQIRFRGAALVRGALRDSGFAEVLSELHRWRATGSLLVERAPVKKLIWLREGAPIFVRSNLMAEALGQVLVRERMINVAECETAIARIQSSKRLLGTELIEMGCISPANLAYALQLQAEEKLYELFNWTDGAYRFNPRSEMPELQVALEATPARILHEGVRRSFDDARIHAELVPVADQAAVLTDDPLDRFQDMGLDPEEGQLYALIDGRRTVRDLLDTALLPESDAERLLHALRLANMIHFAPRPDPRSEPPRLQPRPPPIPPERAVPEPELRKRQVIERLAARAQDLRRGTFFEVLAVQPAASAEEIERAWATLAREHHPNRLGQSAPAEALALAEDIFAQLSLAHDTLADPARRAAYELELQSGIARGDGAEVDRIVRAEQCFRLGEERLLAGDAAAALEQFGEAVRLYPEEAEFHACAGWAEWLAGAPAEAAASRARPILDRAIALNPRLDRAYVFRGRISRALGRAAEAAADFERALLCNPACAEALSELRLGEAR